MRKYPVNRELFPRPTPSTLTCAAPLPDGRTLTDAQLAAMTYAELNAALRCYRPDLRASLADAEAYADAWNNGGNKPSTCARVTVFDFPTILIFDRTD